MNATWRFLDPGRPHGLTFVTRYAAEADALLSLRDPRLGDGAGQFIREVVAAVLLADLWSAIDVAEAADLRTVVLLDTIAATGLRLLADFAITGYPLDLPGGVRLSELLRQVNLHEAAVVAADALLAAVPAPVGLVEGAAAR